MASVVSICNLALSHLGDRATLSSIDPPEGSAQADHCAQFWPIARDEALGAYDWRFAHGFAELVEYADTVEIDPKWQYAYALPADHLVTRAFDYGDGTTIVFLEQGSPLFDTGTLENGTTVLFANDTGLVLQYTRRVNDPTRYPPGFVAAVSYLLASYLAGPVVKGRTAVQMAAAMRTAWERLASKAAITDANQNQTHTRFQPAGVRARGGAPQGVTIERGSYRYEYPGWTG